MLEQAHVVTSSDPTVVKVTAPVTPDAARAPEAASASPDQEESPQRRSLWKMVLTIIALGAMSGAFLFVPIDWDSVGNWGYVGVFLVTFVATASFILPIPYLLIVARAGMYMNPLGVTLVAGVAGALGETTGYIIGASGRDLFPSGKLYEKANHWMVTYGFWCVAFFAFVPNPFFDAIGFAAGVLRYPMWKFVVACFLGKSLKFLLASESHLMIHWTCMVFPQVCDVWRTLSFGLLG
jgi:membrane protein YqaA with SNARE-associated domain